MNKALTFRLEMLKQFLYLLRHHLELIVWCIALLMLYGMDTASTFSFCVYKWAGLSGCPGCGIGHAMHYAMHFNFQQSWQHHWFGIPAVVIIFIRVIQLSTKIKKHVPTSFTHSQS
jgi:hypothetical protein